MPVRRNKKINKTEKRTPPTFLDSTSIYKIRKIVLKWGETNFRNFPWRTPDKLWHGLLAEVLLQRTRATSVVKVYEALVSKYPEPVNLEQAPLEKLEELIFPLGLRWRVPLIKKLGETLNLRGGKPPDSLDELKLLPGVGSYAAAAFLGFHAGKRAVIIDANVVRWICRLLDKICDGETRRKPWLINEAERLTPKRNVAKFNYAILDFTMSICAKVPQCHKCPIGSKLCLTGRKILAERENV